LELGIIADGERIGMEIHQLRYFCAVARHGTFTRAAQAERVAQPSLSQQILKLEAELGTRLFDRLPKSAKLTSFGTAFLPNAERILRELSEAKTEILEMSGEERGEISVGAIPTVAPYLLPSLFSSFYREHSTVTVNVVEDITQTLLERLHAGTIDLMVAALPVQGDEFVSFELLREPFFVVVSERHPYSHRKSIRIEELKDERFLLLKEGHCFRDSTMQLCRKSKVIPQVVFESGQFATIMGMVSAGMGISAVPQMAVQTIPGCRFIPIDDDRAMRRIGVVMLNRHYQTRAEKAFTQHLVRGCACLQRKKGVVRRLPHMPLQPRTRLVS
jgi:LysR family hydrogen peroxide-inducible transcriptional activator